LDANWQELAGACLAGAETGAMAFPQIVEKLMEAGFDGYSVDLRAATATYYLPSGASVRLEAERTSLPVAERFDAKDSA
jgi:uncharacterized protein YbcV (DUF1398 family)